MTIDSGWPCSPHSFPPLPSYSPRQLHIARHNRHAPGVNRAQVAVLEEADQVRLGRLLQRQQCLRLPPVRLVGEVTHRLLDELGEGQLANEELGALLVLAYLLEGADARPVPVAAARDRGLAA